MIPYVGRDTIEIAGLTIQVWGSFVAAGFLLGTWIAARRAKRLGLSVDHIYTIASWIFVAAMIGARLFHVVVYEPGYYLEHPWKALDPREPGYAITGGFLGAAAVFAWYVHKKALSWISYADALIWGVPWGCGVGRIGCFLIHDHPGTLTHLRLGVEYPDGQVRHDLGLYLSLVGFGTGLVFLLLNQRPRPPGFWAALFLVIEGMSRVLLDQWRVVDARYFGMTPAQVAGVLFVCAGATWLWRLRVKQNDCIDKCA
jgi:phosphatidylglycerol:prolipoprotein diacylglycerol transferase